MNRLYLRNMKKILIADDDTAILEATKLLLEYEGYEVDTVSDGETVLQLQPDFPGIILLDIWLSGTNGGEIAKQLKSAHMTKHIPIIMFSANRDIEKISRLAGADDFLIKPFELNDLLEKIKKYLT
jgi:DNA-binding response OmpR family regulator